MEHQIIAVANQLIKNGKKPTVAMVRAKLTQHVPMPLLLRTLQKLESMTAAQIAELVTESPGANPTKNPANSDAKDDELAALKQQVNALHNEVALLKQELKQQSNEIAKLIERTQS